MKVAIISPKVSLEVINQVIDHGDFGCTFKRYVYETLEQVDDIYEDCKNDCDVILCSGELVYNRISIVKGVTDNCFFVSYEDKHILSIFLNFAIKHPEIPLNRVYCDFLTPHNNFMNLHQYLEAPNMPYIFDSYHYNYKNLTKRALELMEDGKIDIVLTRSTNLLPRFDELKIPYIHFLPTPAMVAESVINAVNNGKLKTAPSYHNICIIISVIYPEYASAKEQEYLSVTMYKSLLDYRRKYNSSFEINRSSYRFEITCTAERYSDHAKMVQDLTAYLTEKKEAEFRLGAGVSPTPQESYLQAEIALQESMKYGKSDGFILHSQTKLLTGPLTLSDELHYSYSNQKATSYSQKNGINESNLLKIVGLFQMNKDTIISSQFLAKWLNITPRSCNRIIQQLLDSCLIKEISVLRQDGKGRPQRRYEFCAEYFRETLL